MLVESLKQGNLTAQGMLMYYISGKIRYSGETSTEIEGLTQSG